MTVRCVVLDFDGTFTDVDVEAEPFAVAFRSMVADILGRPTVDEEWREHVARIEAEPQRHGWEYQRRIVAPATSDPYILSTTVAQELFAAAGVLRDVHTRTAVVQALYQHAYANTTTSFRREAREVLETILATNIPVTFVTNSETEKVKEKLSSLLPAVHEGVTVRGGAKKYVIADPVGGPSRWGSIPFETKLDGLTRPILLHRGSYFTALEETLRAAGCSADELLVCGDIYELDLALPVALGASVHLVRSPRTPAYELAAIDALPRASSGTLLDVLGRLRGS